MYDAAEAVERELIRWRAREQRLLESVKEVDEERRRLEEELAKVDQQVAYYDSLTRDMKRELIGSGRSSFLRSLRRP